MKDKSKSAVYRLMRSDRRNRLGTYLAALIVLHTVCASMLLVVGCHLKDSKKEQFRASRIPTNSRPEEQTALKQPLKVYASLTETETLIQLGQTNRVIEILAGVLNEPKLDSNAILAVAQQAFKVGSVTTMEAALERLVEVIPDTPEVWYDLAALKATLDKPAEATEAARCALDLNHRRLQKDPKAYDLSICLQNDSRFDGLRNTPEFQQILAPK